MRVTDITITNYRAFEGERHFALSDRFTVIAGINGRGKTAVLDAMALLISRLLRSLALSEGDLRTIRESDVYSGADAAQLSMRTNCAGKPIRFKASYRPDRRRVMTTRLSAPVRDEVVRAYGDPNRPDDQAPIAVYYTTDRAGFRMPRTLPETLPVGQKAANSGALVNRMVDYRDFMARYRVWQAAQQTRVMVAVDKAIKVFLDGFGDLRVEEDPLRLVVKKGAHHLDLGQLSDGERAFIAVLADLVRRLSLANPELYDPLQGHGVVLIDELELHLHPQWQRTVVENLRETFPNIQFVATTHSPFIIQSLRGGELISLDPDEFPDEYANRSIEDIAEHIQGVRIPQKSERFRQMVQVAEDFIRRSRQAQNKEEIAAVQAELDRIAEAYSDDPAYIALLRVEREAVNATG